MSKKYTKIPTTINMFVLKSIHMGKILTKTLLIISLAFNAIFLYTILQNSTATNPTENVSDLEEIQQDEEASVTYESGISYPLMRIVDGDTIIIGFNNSTEYVRLIGIDSPEPNDPGGPQCYANESTAHLQELARTGIVILHFDESQGMHDSYGRLLAYVELPDGTDLGKQMLSDGYAREYTYNAEYDRQNGYKTAEGDAVGGEKGLWGPSVCE